MSLAIVAVVLQVVMVVEGVGVVVVGDGVLVVVDIGAGDEGCGRGPMLNTPAAHSHSNCMTTITTTSTTAPDLEARRIFAFVGLGWPSAAWDGPCSEPWCSAYQWPQPQPDSSIPL